MSTLPASLTASTATTTDLVITNAQLFTIDLMPEDLLFKIGSILPQLNDLRSLLSVNQHYYQYISNSQQLWDTVLQNRFPDYYRPDLTLDEIKSLINLVRFKEGILPGHKRGIRCIAVRDNKLFSSSKDNTIKVWDLNSGKELFSLDLEDWINYFAVQGDNLFVAKGSSIEIWDLNQRKKVSVLKGHKNWVSCLLVDNDRLYSGDGDNQIISWDWNQRKELHPFTGHLANRELKCLAFHQGNLISGSTDNTIKIWDVKSGTELFTLRILESSTAGEESCNQTGHRPRTARKIAIYQNTLFAGVPSGAIEVWDLEKREWLQTLKGHESEEELTWLRGMIVYKDILITCSTDKTIKFWSIKTLKELLTLQCNNSVMCIAIHQGKLYAGLDNGEIPFWDFNRQSCSFPPLKDEKKAEAGL